MDTQIIYEAFSQIAPLTPEAWQEFEPLVSTLTLTRNEFLVMEGTAVEHAYFLVDGVVRVYYSQDGNEYNKTFFIPGMFPTALTALISRAPSALSFQALTPCKLLQFSYRKMQDLYPKHRCFESLMLKIIEQQWIKKERHDIRMVTNDATTNYLIFREEFPGLENLIPQYHIASYLGITPIQLSRIRSQMAQSN